MVAFCADKEQNHASFLSLGLILKIYSAEDIKILRRKRSGTGDKYILVVSTIWT